jgi:hypothetical protein
LSVVLEEGKSEVKRRGRRRRRIKMFNGKSARGMR